MADAVVSDDDIPLLELFDNSDSDTTSSEDSSTDSDDEYEPKPVRICCLLLLMKCNFLMVVSGCARPGRRIFVRS